MLLAKTSAGSIFLVYSFFTTAVGRLGESGSEACA
jgi:hypothetical protein